MQDECSPKSDANRHTLDQLMDAQREVDDIMDEDDDCNHEDDQLIDDMVPASSSPAVSSPAAATPTDDDDNDLLCISHAGSGYEAFYASSIPDVGLTAVDRPHYSYRGGSTHLPLHNHEQEGEARVGAESPELISEDELYPFEQSPFIPRLHELLLLAQRDHRRAHPRRYISVDSNASVAIKNTTSEAPVSTSNSCVFDSIGAVAGISGAFAFPTSDSQQPVLALRSIVPVSDSRRLVSDLRPVLHNSTLAIFGFSDTDTFPRISSAPGAVSQLTSCVSQRNIKIRQDTDNNNNPAIAHSEASTASSSPLSQTKKYGTINQRSRVTLKRRHPEIPESDAYTPSNHAYTPKGI